MTNKVIRQFGWINITFLVNYKKCNVSQTSTFAVDTKQAIVLVNQNLKLITFLYNRKIEHQNYENITRNRPYFKFGFVACASDRPQRLIGHSILSNGALEAAKLKSHLKKLHTHSAGKTEIYFQRKKEAYI